MASDSSRILSSNDSTKFVEALQGDLSWQWDSRFKTVLTQFNTDEKDAVKKILECYLGTAWDSITIKTVPESMQSILARLGGIMTGQLFYGANLPENGIVFCAWWPWGNGQTISIRLGTNLEDSTLLDTLAKPDAR